MISVRTHIRHVSLRCDVISFSLSRSLSLSLSLSLLHSHICSWTTHTSITQVPCAFVSFELIHGSTISCFKRRRTHVHLLLGRARTHPKMCAPVVATNFGRALRPGILLKQARRSRRGKRDDPEPGASWFESCGCFL